MCLYNSVQCGSSHSDLAEFLKVKFDDSVNKHLSIDTGVSFGYVDDVRFQNNGVNLTVVGVLELVDGGDGAVVVEAVFAADDAEAEEVLVVVEDLEALGAGGGGEARDDGDFTDAADAAVAGAHVAALDEVLVLLRVLEAPDEGPHRVCRRVDALRYDGAADFRGRFELVVRVDDAFEFREFLWG